MPSVALPPPASSNRNDNRRSHAATARNQLEVPPTVHPRTGVDDGPAAVSTPGPTGVRTRSAPATKASESSSETLPAKTKVPTSNSLDPAADNKTIPQHHSGLPSPLRKPPPPQRPSAVDEVEVDPEYVETIEDREPFRSLASVPPKNGANFVTNQIVQIVNYCSSAPSGRATALRVVFGVENAKLDSDEASAGKESDHSPALDARGLALGCPGDGWKVVKLASTWDSSDPDADRTIRCGDTILLQTTQQGELVHRWALSVPRGVVDGRAPVPCVKPVDEQAVEQQWTVVRGVRGAAGVLRIGPTAMVAAAERQVALQRRYREWLASRSRPTSVAASMWVSSAVTSGDPLVLRNCHNGGVLSVRADGSLGLLTDSYDGCVNRSGVPELDDSLMGRLQRHDFLAPSEQELLYIFPAAVPCPVVHAGNDPELLHNSFRNGSYLSHGHRHTVDAQRDQAIFEPSLPQGYHSQVALMRAGLSEVSSQELVLLDETLGSFLGLEGCYIQAVTTPSSRLAAHSDVAFRLVDDPRHPLDFDPSLRHLLDQLVPLATSYTYVRAFVGSHLPGCEYGTVMQALCEKLDFLLQDYVSFIGLLDHRYRQSPPPQGSGGSLLRCLLVDVRIASQQMRILHQVVDTVSSEIGGALLNALESLERRWLGDPVASSLLKTLLNAAAAPYFQIFRHWIELGELNDRYGEFMVRFDAQARNWEDRYVLVSRHVLVKFFPSAIDLSRVVATGRYWNAAARASQVRHAASLSGPSTFASIAFSSHVADFLALVQAIHRKASRVLVDLLLGDFSLLNSLRLTRRYFLLDQGDFFVNFMDSAEVELLKEASIMTLGRIQHWLSGAVARTEHEFEPVCSTGSRTLGGSTAARLPFHILCQFSSGDVVTHLDKLHLSPQSNKSLASPRQSDDPTAIERNTGLDKFLIDFQSVPFPISLVLTPLAMRSYQLLFRHLFYAKYVERRLVGIWQDHQATKELQSLRGALGSAFLLRQRMLHLVQNLIYYMMLEVIEPNWISLEHEITSEENKKMQTADDIRAAHATFLRRTLESCLLTNRDVLRSLAKLLGTCLLFTNEMKLFMKATRLDEDRHTLAKEKRKRTQRSRNDRAGSRRSSQSRNTVAKILMEDIAQRQDRVKQQIGRVGRETSSESYRQMIVRFDEVFSHQFCDFLLQLKYTEGFYQTSNASLCTRLDYNGRISKALGLSTETKRRGSSN